MPSTIEDPNSDTDIGTGDEITSAVRSDLDGTTLDQAFADPSWPATNAPELRGNRRLGLDLDLDFDLELDAVRAARDRDEFEWDGAFVRALLLATAAAVPVTGVRAPYAPGEWDAVADDDDDRQNVHDHSVAAATRRNLRELRARVPATTGSIERTVSIVMDFVLESDASVSVKSDAFEVLDSLKPDHDASAGDSQLGALHTVWTVAGQIADPVKRNDVRMTLVDQLASAREHGAVVCSSGIIARIVGTFDGIDDEVLDRYKPPRPFWIVRQELAALASRVRDEHESADDARSEFEREAIALYVDELGMEPNVIRPVIEEYAGGFA